MAYVILGYLVLSTAIGLILYIRLRDTIDTMMSIVVHLAEIYLDAEIYLEDKTGLIEVETQKKHTL